MENFIANCGAKSQHVITLYDVSYMISLISEVHVGETSFEKNMGCGEFLSEGQ